MPKQIFQRPAPIKHSKFGAPKNQPYDNKKSQKIAKPKKQSILGLNRKPASKPITQQKKK